MDRARVVGDLRIGIDETLCVGFGDCVTRAPEAFRLNDEGMVEFVEPHRVDRAGLLAACAACPVDALLVWDAHGTPLVPCPPDPSTDGSGGATHVP